MSFPPEYKIGEEVASRKAYGTALVKLAEQNKRVIALDGDVSNSTFSELVAKKFPDQFIECFIGEQNMVGVGVGLSKSYTFGCFIIYLQVAVPELFHLSLLLLLF